MTDIMKSCIKLYCGFVDGIVPGSSKLVTLADLPTDSSGGGNAPAIKVGDRWEHYPIAKAWRRIHDRPRTALFTPTGTKGGPRADNLLPTRVTRMAFASWTDNQPGSDVTPDGQASDNWKVESSCQSFAAA